MNMDFHYYATYVAARLAGYTFNDSQVIAYASQYVNDYSKDKLNKALTPGLDPIPTSQTYNEIAKYDLDRNWSETHLVETSRIYIPFHFLPGNYGSNLNKKSYTGKKFDESHINYKFQYDAEAEEQFKLLCLPNSTLVSEIINDIIENHAEKSYNLELIGLRLHAMSDTWSHSNFVGIPAWFINNTASSLYSIDNESISSIKLTTSWPLTTVSKYEGCEEASPNKPSYNSYVYFGHRRLGHIPDYGYIKYKYKPQWSNKFITRDNFSDFFKAFTQMVLALKCIRNQKTFSVNAYETLDKSTEYIIKKILKTKTHNQTNAWKENIVRIKINDKPLEVPEDYDENKWLKDAENSTDKAMTNYYNFNMSAIMHLELVKSILKENKIFIDEIPKENILDVTIQNKNQEFIGNSQNDYLIYPKLGNTETKLSIIKPNDNVLKSGDIVKIKTSDHTTGEYCYLGAWTKLSFYYYKKDFNMSKQKWRIEKVDCSIDDTIRSGDLIYIENLYFSDQPYMAYYKYLNGDFYLNTVSKKTDRTEWFINSYIEENTYYNIVAKHSQKYVKVQNNDTKDCAQIVQFHQDESDSEKFKFVACGNGYYYIIAKHSQKCLQVENGSINDLSPVLQYSLKKAQNSKIFKIVPCGNGYYNIIAKHSQKCLTVEHNNLSDSAPIVQQHFKGLDNQKFKLKPVK